MKKLNDRHQIPGRKFFTDVEVPQLFKSTKTTSKTGFIIFRVFCMHNGYLVK